MENILQGLLPITIFSEGGSFFMTILLLSAGIIALSAFLNLYSPRPLYQRSSTIILAAINFFFYCRFSVDLLVSLADILENAS